MKKFLALYKSFWLLLKKVNFKWRHIYTWIIQSDPDKVPPGDERVFKMLRFIFRHLVFIPQNNYNPKRFHVVLSNNF